MRRPSYGKYPKLASWMKEHNMTAKDLAAAMDVSTHAIWCILNGITKRPNPYTKEAFERVTGMTIEEAMNVVRKDG